MKYFFLIISLLLSTALIGQKTTWNHNGKVQIKSDGSMVVDDSTFVVDGTNNKVGIGTLAPTVGSALTVSGRISQIGLGNSTFVGFEAGKDDDLSGNSNVAIGYQASYSNLTASYNVANGYQALYTNLSGAYNTAIGYQALYSNSGRNNAANGYKSLYFNTSGFHNTAIGSQAGSYIADKTTAATITNNSVFLGYRTSPLADDETNQIVIGYDATGIGSNSVVLGNDNIVTTILKGNVGIGTTSPIEKFHLQGAYNTDVKAVISAGNENKNAYLYLSTPYNGDAVNYGTKTAIIAEGTTGWSRSKLHFALSNSTSNTYDAGLSDAKMTILPTGQVGIGNTSPSKTLDVTGPIQATSYINAGIGTGSVAMTLNDGYGNANLTFNHLGGKADVTGNAGRIEVNVDGTTDASMSFELKDNLTAGVSTALNEVMKLHSDGRVKLTDYGNQSQLGTATGLIGVTSTGYLVEEPLSGSNTWYNVTYGTNTGNGGYANLQCMCNADGQVFFKGTHATTATVSSGATIMTLPTECRPNRQFAHRENITNISNGLNVTDYVIIIRTNGVITCNNSLLTNYSLNMHTLTYNKNL